MLRHDDIILNQPKEDKVTAIKRCGELLVNAGYASEEYIDGMIKRDASFSVAIGNLIAIPHGETEYKKYIKKTGISVITYPEAIDWDGNQVNMVIGIAGLGEEHMEVLENIVDVLEEEEDTLRLVSASDKETIIKAFTGGN